MACDWSIGLDREQCFKLNTCRLGNEDDKACPHSFLDVDMFTSSMYIDLQFLWGSEQAWSDMNSQDVPRIPVILIKNRELC